MKEGIRKENRGSGGSMKGRKTLGNRREGVEEDEWEGRYQEREERGWRRMNRKECIKEEKRGSRG